jgi:hypothetical protein
MLLRSLDLAVTFLKGTRMSNILFLNKSQQGVGLQVYTYTVPSAGTAVPLGGAGIYNVQIDVTVPQADREGDGAGSNTGLGSGAGGGGTGFTGGGQGPGNGGVGQSQASNSAPGVNGSGYPQPSLYGSNETSTPAVNSSLVVTITQNGSNVYTSPAFVGMDSQLKAKIPLLCAVADAIVVTLASSAAPDIQLNSIKSIISINQGM